MGAFEQAFMQEQENPTQTAVAPLEQEPSRLRGVIAAARETWIGSTAAWVGNKLISSMYATDANFDPYSKLEDMRDNGLTGTQQKAIVDMAKNEDHYRLLKRVAIEEKRNADSLDSLGAEGFLYRIGGAIAETGGLAVLTPTKLMGVVDTGITAASSIFKTVGLSEKASTVLASASAGTLFELGLENVRQANKINEGDELDYVLAGIGGAIGGALYKPAKAHNAIATSVRDSVNETLEEISDIVTNPDEIAARSSKLDNVKHKKLAQFMESIQFDTISKLTSTPSRILTDLSDKLFHNPRTMGVDDFSVVERATLVTDTLKMKLEEVFNPVYFDWYKETGQSLAGSNKFARFHSAAQQEFSVFMGRVAAGIIDETTNPELAGLIGKARKASQDMATGAYDILEQNGHRLFKDNTIPRDPDWFMRQWSSAKFMNAIASGSITKKEMRQLIRAGFTSGLRNAGKEITPEIEKIIKAKADKFLKAQENLVKANGKEVFAQAVAIDNRIDSLMSEFDELIDGLDRIDGTITAQTASDTLREAAAITGKESKSTQPVAKSAKRRNLIDMTEKITSKAGVTYSLNDFIDTDFYKLYTQYATQMGGDTALQQLGIKSRGDLVALRQTVYKDLVRIYGTGKSSKVDDIMVNLDETFKQLLGMPTAKDPNGLGQTAVTQLNMFARTMKLGSVGVSMVTELVKSVYAVGLPNFVRTLPELANVVRNNPSEAYNELRSFLALDNLYKLPMSSMYDELHTFKDGKIALDSTRGDKAITFMNDVVKPKLTGAWELTSMVGGMKPLTSLFETIVASGTQTRVMRHVMSGKTLDPRIAKEMGWSQSTFNTIADNIRRYADTTNKGGDLMNFDMWDREAAAAYAMGLRRLSKIVVQRGEIGDDIGAVWAGETVQNSIGGKLMFALKDYALKAYSRQFSRSVNNFDGRILGEWIATAGGAYLVYMAKAHLASGGDEDKLEKALETSAIINGTISNFPAASVIPMFLNTGSQFFTGQSLVDSTQRGNSGTLEPAAISVISDMAKVPSAVLGLGLDGVNVSAKRIEQGIKSMFPNFIGMNYLAHGVGEYLGEEDEDLAEEEANTVTALKAVGLAGAAAVAGKTGQKIYKAIK